ncbi:MAG: penicillin acylase family protein [Marinoscillum sp.]
MSRIFGVLLLFLGTVCSAQIDPHEVEIIRDQYGVPHIYAPTDAGVAYGLAWAHAEDDFQTIQLTMLSGKGMLGRHLGKSGAAVDYVVELLRCKEIVEEQWPLLSDDYKALINAYTEGINSYALSHPKKVLLKGSFPVTVDEVLRAYVLSLAVISGADQVIGNLVKGEVEAAPDLGDKGSNAFAFARSKTTDDHVYLNINSHQPLEGPTAWYEAHLVSDEGWNALGGLFPGGATIFHGTNSNLGWAHTVNYPDKIDIFELEVDGKDNLKYKFDNQYKVLELEEVEISVRILFGIKIKIKRPVYWSIYGPVIKNDKGFFAFDLGALHDLRAPEQWYRMNKARNWEEFREALEMVALPGFNIIYADKDDNIFYLGNAKIPIRNPRYDWSKTLPGNTSETLINAYHVLDDLPQIFNPPSGYVFNTNNSAFNCTFGDENPHPKDYDSTMGYLQFENNRSIRFMELMDQYEKVSWEDFLKIKYDDTLPEKLNYPIDASILFQLDSTAIPTYQKLIHILQNWDKTSHYSNLGSAQFLVLYGVLKDQYKASYTGEKYSLNKEEILDGIAQAQRYLLKHFKRVDIRLSDYQFLVRGEKEIPVSGIPDVMTAMYSKPYKDGRAKAVQGESLIILVKYPEEGLPMIETMNVYGASNQPESPHFDDQMIPFVNKERKYMTLDLEEVRANAKSIYHPIKE